MEAVPRDSTRCIGNRVRFKNTLLTFALFVTNDNPSINVAHNPLQSISIYIVNAIVREWFSLFCISLALFIIVVIVIFMSSLAESKETHSQNETLTSNKKNSAMYFYDYTQYHTVYILIIIYCILSVSSGKYCDIAKSCIGQSLNDAGTSYIRGYKAAYGPSTSSSGGGIDCSGSFSCDSMAFMHALTARIYCYGSNSCSNTTIVSTAVDSWIIICYGANACSGSDITTISDSTSGSVLCDGSNSCAHSYIHGVESISVKGQFALLNATIDTLNITGSTITIALYGSFSGFGAKLLCREGHQCDIWCYTVDSCFMFYTECLGTCILHTLSDNGYVPITNIAEFVAVSSASVGMNAIHNDELCDTDLWTFDDSGAGYRLTITDAITNVSSICCRGYSSCNRLEIHVSFGGNYDLLCSGANACKSMMTSNHNGSIFCESYSACYLASIINAANIYCSGTYSCNTLTVTNSSFVVCGGLYSCEAALFISGGEDLHLYLTGYNSGISATLYCNDTDFCNIYIIGSNAGGITLFCNDNCNVECDAAHSQCPDAPPTTSYARNGTPIASTHTTFAASSLYTQSSKTNNVTSASRDTSIISTSNSASFEPTETDAVINVSESDNNNNKLQLMIILWSVIGCIAMCFCVVVVILCIRKRRRKAERQDIIMISMTHNSDNDHVKVDREVGADDNKAVSDVVDEGDNEGENESELVGVWLCSTVGLEQYVDSFIKNGYDSLEFISKITDAKQLVEIGVVLPGHKTQIMAEIEALKREQKERLGNEDSDHKNDDLWENEHRADVEREGREAAQNTSSNVKVDTQVDADDNKALSDVVDERELVGVWLCSTVGLEQYFDSFIKNGYDSLEFISKITDPKQLVEIGVVMPGHKTQIMAEIEALKHEQKERSENEDSDHKNDDLWENEGRDEPQNTSTNASKGALTTSTDGCHDA